MVERVHAVIHGNQAYALFGEKFAEHTRFKVVAPHPVKAFEDYSANLVGIDFRHQLLPAGAVIVRTRPTVVAQADVRFETVLLGIFDEHLALIFNTA
jgi:hypothetical protein